jgi:arabinofuranosyltransferase
MPEQGMLHSLLSRRLQMPLVLFFVFCIAAWFAYHNYFMQDDAYISFRYAKHFAEGKGLVWYPGSNEYGYTNFLYTLLIGCLMFFGIEPETASTVINIICFFAALYFAYRLTLRLSSSLLAALCVVTVLATHHSFTAYASGGLETMLVTTLVLAFYYTLILYEKTPIRKYIWSLALLTTIALLTRLDASLLLIPGYVVIGRQWLKRYRTHITLEISEIAIIAGLPFLILTCFLIGCYLYYHQPLPTTFYLKIPNDQGMVRSGWRYLVLYSELQSHISFVLATITLIFSVIAINRSAIPGLRYLAALTGVLLLWLAYVVYIGGDFMEFRQLVPVLPVFFILIFWSAAAFSGRTTYDGRTLLVGLLIVAVFANHLHASRFKSRPGVYDFVDKGFIVETTDGLYEWLNRSRINWRIIGQRLHDLFYTGGEQDVKIAVNPAGAIPFYSELQAVDMLGINSKIILSNHNNAYRKHRPGHRMIGTREVLESEQVNLVILHPQTLCRRKGRLVWTRNFGRTLQYTYKETLLLPLDNGCYLVADYFLPHPRIEELIAQGVILRYTDVRERTKCPRWLCRV